MREANDRGYDCLLVEDATESYFPEFKAAALEMIRAQGAIVGWTAPSAAAGHWLQVLVKAGRVPALHTTPRRPPRPSNRPTARARTRCTSSSSATSANSSWCPVTASPKTKSAIASACRARPCARPCSDCSRKGYVEVLFRSGWRVLPFDFDQFEQLYDLRMVLETTAAHRLCDGRRCKPVDRALLDELVAIWLVPTAQRSTDTVQVANGTRPFTARWSQRPATPKWRACIAM